MKLQNLRLKRGVKLKKLEAEDMRYLQKKVTGKSVYRGVRATYTRYPKHKSRLMSYETV